jgi:DNA-binding response OmpR family regulator/DNA-binding HxlR family transcriptional regulator
MSEMTEDLQRLQNATELFSRKWNPLILYTVAQVGEASYTDIERSIDGISPKMLSDGLTELCDRDLLVKEDLSGDMDRTQYHLTQSGEGLSTVLSALVGWEDRCQTTNPTVLLAEDESMVVDLIADYLEDSYTLRRAQTGQETLEMVSDDVAVVLLDLRLPDMPGADVADRLESQAPETPICVLSETTPDEHIVEMPVDDYIQKPIGKDQLHCRLEDMCRRDSLDEQARRYLALQSKRRALRATHGNEATHLDAYEGLERRLDSLEMTPEQRASLDALLADAEPASL